MRQDIQDGIGFRLYIWKQPADLLSDGSHNPIREDALRNDKPIQNLRILVERVHCVAGLSFFGQQKELC